MRRTELVLSIALILLGLARLCRGDEAVTEPSPGIVRSGFIYETAPTPECHASTIAETPRGLVAAWFGGTEEGNDDVGSWFARLENGAWTTPVEVANGVESPEKRYPCWNPVLHQAEGGPLVLFYKVGPEPDAWWGMKIATSDGGNTWSEPKRLPDEILGPVKNKAVLLPDGRLLCGSSSEHDGWRVHMEWTRDLGETWDRTGPLNDGKTTGAIQPSILIHPGDRLQIVCRSRGVGKILTAWSKDAGETWTALEPLDMPNPNSGIDAVTMRGGRHLLVYNHTPRGRTPLNVAVSDDGLRWRAAAVLESEPGEYSYPAVIQTSDGLIHALYTWKRKLIKHVVLDPEKFALTELKP